MFEWDETKRLATAGKHGIDFLDALKIFKSQHVVLTARSDYELRFIAVGLVNGMEVAVVHTHRGENIRIITARRARRHEKAAYHARYA